MLALAPDLSVAGYLLGPRVGATSYNAVHAYVAPLLLAASASVVGRAWGLSAAHVWAAHVGTDRALGVGLKGPGGFEFTHLQIGRRYG